MLGTSELAPVRGVRPGDARPRRCRLRRRRRGPGRPRAPRRRADRRDAAGVHHQQRRPDRRSRWPRTCASSASRRTPTTSSPPLRRRRGCWSTGSEPARAVVCLGSDGLREALLAAGLTPVGAEDDAAAIATGYGPDVRWAAIMRAAVRIRDGLPWVASNTDAHDPDGVRGRARATASRWRCCAGSPGVDPVVAGKPERPLLDETVRRVGGQRPLMVGDRLDTDIEGARHVGAGLAAGAHRRDRAGRAGRGAGGASGRRTSPPTWTGLLVAHPAPAADRGRLASRRLAVRGRGRRAPSRPATATSRTGGGRSRRRRGRTSTRPANRCTCPGSRRPRGSLGP